MLITILAGGSRGDTQPYIALGLALKNAGCSVRLATHENYESFIKGHGLDFFPIRGDVSRLYPVRQAGRRRRRTTHSRYC